MLLTLSCKLVKVIAVNPAFSVAPMESPRYGSPLLWRTTIETAHSLRHSLAERAGWAKKAGPQTHDHNSVKS